MNIFHVNSVLTAYLHGELKPEEQQRVERHLARCARCRAAAGRLRAVDAALPLLPTCSAPEKLWGRIEERLNSTAHSPLARSAAKSAESQRPTMQNASRLAAAGTTARADADGRNGSGPKRTAEPRGRNGTDPKGNEPAVGLTDNLLRPRRASRWMPVALASVALLAAAGLAMWTILQPASPGWGVRTLQGRPVIGWFAFGDHGKLRVGDTLVTDKRSRAEIDVADIGIVKVAPGSRVRLAATGSAQHRLDLEQGALEAKVTAPPRLFVVDTRAGRAVDLGCAYRLETDGRQSTLLSVTLGEVALEDADRSSLVPRGFSCESRRVGGLGTPIRTDASEQFRAAVRRFDFESGGDAAAEQARAAVAPADAITLWHMLRRCSALERGRIFDTMAGLSRPPNSVGRAGIVAGDLKMLDDWKQAILYDLAESELRE